MSSLTPEVIAIGWKTPTASKPSPVVLVYQGFDVDEARAAIEAAITKGAVDSARTYRGRQAGYLPLFIAGCCVDRPVPAST